jgi:hypothetical protein
VLCSTPAVNLTEQVTKTVFLFFFMAGEHFFGKKMGVDSKKWRFLHKKWSFPPSTTRLHYLLRPHRLHPVRPCTGSVITVSLSPATTFLFLYIIAFLRTRLPRARTTFSTVGCVNLFLRLWCIHPATRHIGSHEKNQLCRNACFTRI